MMLTDLAEIYIHLSSVVVNVCFCHKLESVVVYFNSNISATRLLTIQHVL